MRRVVGQSQAQNQINFVVGFGPCTLQQILKSGCIFQVSQPSRLPGPPRYRHRKVCKNSAASENRLCMLLISSPVLEKLLASKGVQFWARAVEAGTFRPLFLGFVGPSRFGLCWDNGADCRQTGTYGFCGWQIGLTGACETGKMCAAAVGKVRLLHRCPGCWLAG